MLKPVPYMGDEDYIFISYAHRDSQLVWPIIERLQKDGFRVWYDEGIDPGGQWDDIIAGRIQRSGLFLAFLSENYLLSENCQDELSFARDLRKNQLLLYMEQVQLPAGMQMRLSSCPSFRADAGGRFLRKLYQTEGFEAYRNAAAAPRPKGGRIAIFAALLVLMITGACLAGKLVSPAGSDQPPDETVPSAEQLVLTEYSWLKLAIQDIHFSQEEGLALTIQNASEDPFEEHLLFTNCYLNCKRLPDTYLSFGTENSTSLSWTPEQLREAGLSDIQSAADVLRLDGMLVLSPDYPNPTTVDFTYYPFGQKYAESLSFIPEEDDRLLADTGAYLLYLTDSYYLQNSWVTEFVAVNQSERRGYVNVATHNINGYVVSMYDIADGDFSSGGWIRMHIVTDGWTTFADTSVSYAEWSIAVADYSSRETVWEGTYGCYLEENDDFSLELRQHKASDRTLLENEYIRLEQIEILYDENQTLESVYLYCLNLYDEETTVSIDSDVFFYETVYLQPGEQSILVLSVENINAISDRIPITLDIDTRYYNGYWTSTNLFEQDLEIILKEES